jgi:hypothetical protein
MPFADFLLLLHIIYLIWIMKKKLLTTMLLASALSASAGDYDYLTFVTTDGSKTSLPAVGLTITFSNGNLVASNGSASATIALSNMASMSFTATDATTTAIGTSLRDDSSLTLDDAEAIYDLSGRSIPTGQTLTKGIYIIKKGSETRKIQIK